MVSHNFNPSIHRRQRQMDIKASRVYIVRLQSSWGYIDTLPQKDQNQPNKIISVIKEILIHIAVYLFHDCAQSFCLW